MKGVVSGIRLGGAVCVSVGVGAGVVSDILSSCTWIVVVTCHWKANQDTGRRFIQNVFGMEGGRLKIVRIRTSPV